MCEMVDSEDQLWIVGGFAFGPKAKDPEKPIIMSTPTQPLNVNPNAAHCTVDDVG